MKYLELGNLLYKKRIEKGLTQEELGEIIGVNSKTISKWERGICLPSIKMLKKLSNVLYIRYVDMFNFI